MEEQQIRAPALSFNPRDLSLGTYRRKLRNWKSHSVAATLSLRILQAVLPCFQLEDSEDLWGFGSTHLISVQVTPKAALGESGNRDLP